MWREGKLNERGSTEGMDRKKRQKEERMKGNRKKEGIMTRGSGGFSVIQLFKGPKLGRFDL